MKLQSVVTRASINQQIESYDNQIRELEERIEKLKSLSQEKKILLEKLSALEMKPLSERSLYKTIYESTRTMKIFDEFETLTAEGFQKYKRLIITNNGYGPICKYQLIVERREGRETVGDITITDFKQGYHNTKLYDYIVAQINKYAEVNRLVPGIDILFDTPYALRAQNKSNRTGYGSIYHGEDLVHEGTKYGETTAYAFVGVNILRVYE